MRQAILKIEGSLTTFIASKRKNGQMESFADPQPFIVAEAGNEDIFPGSFNTSGDHKNIVLL